jgi:hypothetical protein
MALGKVLEGALQNVVFVVRDDGGRKLDRACVTGNCFPIRVRTDQPTGICRRGRAWNPADPQRRRRCGNGERICSGAIRGLMLG